MSDDAHVLVQDAIGWSALKTEAANRERQICGQQKDYVIAYVHPCLSYTWRKSAPRDEWQDAQRSAYLNRGEAPYGATFALGRVFYFETPYMSRTERCYVSRMSA